MMSSIKKSSPSPSNRSGENRYGAEHAKGQGHVNNDGFPHSVVDGLRICKPEIAAFGCATIGFRALRVCGLMWQHNAGACWAITTLPAASVGIAAVHIDLQHIKKVNAISATHPAKTMICPLISRRL